MPLNWCWVINIFWSLYTERAIWGRQQGWGGGKGWSSPMRQCIDWGSARACCPSGMRLSQGGIGIRLPDRRPVGTPKEFRELRFRPPTQRGAQRAFVHWKFRRRITAAVSLVITCTYFSTISSSLLYFPTISSRDVLYTMLRYLDVNEKNKWTIARQVNGYCDYILLHKKSDSIYNECIYSTQSTRPSSITLVDIPRESPRKFRIGRAGWQAELMGYFEGSVAVGRCCIEANLRWLAKCVNATTLSEVRRWNTSVPWACWGCWWRVTLAIMWCGCSAHWYRGFNVLHGSHIFLSWKVLL